MRGTDRVEVLCAARLEGPGLERWSPAQLVAVAISRAGKIEVSETLTERSHRGGGQPWRFSRKVKTEQEAVAQVKAIAEHPEDVFESGQTTGTLEKREVLKALFAGLKLISLIDTTQGQTELSGTATTIGVGRYLTSWVEGGADLTAEISAGIGRYFSNAPFTFGYWAPYKRLIKLLENKPEALDLLGTALARIDGQLFKVASAQASDELRAYVSPTSAVVAGPDTMAYMMRRGRRLVRKFGRESQAKYVRCAQSILRATDLQGSQTNIAQRWILADILYGRGIHDDGHGHGLLKLPAGQLRYDRRWDRYAKAWNEHLDGVRQIWVETARNTDIQAWAFNVLRSQRQELPLLSMAGLRLALLSPAKKVRGQSCAQVASKPKHLLHLDKATAQAFLEFSSDKQFSAVYPSLESNAEVKAIQDAVLAYINEHGFPAVRRGGTPSTKDKRSAKLLAYSLRYLQSRLGATDTYQLARYVGQTTKFRPVAQWKDTLSALPLKTLVELRLHLPDLPTSVIRWMDNACREAATRSSGDADLAAAMTLSPSPQMRALGWQLLVNADDAAISTVWNHLIAQANTKPGLERLLESARNKERVERLQRHASAGTLWTKLLVAVAGVDPKLAERLLCRLAGAGDTSRTLQTLDLLLATSPDGPWSTRPLVLQKIRSADPRATRLVWGAVNNGELTGVARSHVSTRSLAAALVEVVDLDDLLTLSPARADLLVQALRVAPSRLDLDRRFAVATSTCPHPSLHQLALARLEARRQLGAIFLPLAESGMPAAVATSERYARSLKDKDALTKAIIAICDSGVAPVRSIGLRLFEDRAERFNRNAVVAALAEHTSPEVTAAVARQALAATVIKRDALARFDNRVLRTRRVGRKAKDLVKARLALSVPEGAVSIGANDNVDEQRIQALLDMARGLSLRDRDWALQQLARLALDGHPIPQVQISTTS